MLEGDFCTVVGGELLSLGSYTFHWIFRETITVTMQEPQLPGVELQEEGVSSLSILLTTVLSMALKLPLCQFSNSFPRSANAVECGCVHKS